MSPFPVNASIIRLLAFTIAYLGSYAITTYMLHNHGSLDTK